jgi:hypothetical protein
MSAQFSPLSFRWNHIPDSREEPGTCAVRIQKKGLISQRKLHLDLNLRENIGFGKIPISEKFYPQILFTLQFMNLKPIGKVFDTLAAGLFILLFSISLVLPYSSDYFLRENSSLTETIRYPEKLQVSTSLFSSPAECAITRTVELFPVQAGKLSPLTKYTNLLTCLTSVGKSVFQSYLEWRHFNLMWPPSRVIALRKLLI